MDEDIQQCPQVDRRIKLNILPIDSPSIDSPSSRSPSIDSPRLKPPPHTTMGLASPIPEAIESAIIVIRETFLPQPLIHDKPYSTRHVQPETTKLLGVGALFWALGNLLGEGLMFAGAALCGIHFFRVVVTHKMANQKNVMNTLINWVL